MTALATISQLQEEDEATARLLLELALFDAVGEEIDRLRPDLEADFAKALRSQAAQGLVALARGPVSKASAAAADQLVELVSKDRDDDPSTPYWDARDASGKFRSGKVRRAALNALGLATASPDDEMANRTRAALGNWTGESANKYTRLQSLGQGLVATGDPTAAPAGTVLRLIGDIGPEAQKALEPGIRRAAYRYRGTERRPDPQAQQRVAEIVRHLQGPGQDQQRLRATSDIGVAMLQHQVPDRATAEISLAAGKMPPSVGVMFDSRGRLISEAQGFNGDHYLPFDLKNLKRLKGGSYVRTRTTGGLTDEDVYTGLMTGARHVTVVSNSGVFTLEFDPDLRGGRRYSDKARQMVDRYSRLVGAIGSGELYQNSLPPDRVREIRAEALRLSGGDAETAKTIATRKIREAQAAAAFLGRDDDEIMAEAEANVSSDPRHTARTNPREAIKAEFNRLKTAEMQKSTRRYRLDGEGYKAAMKALKTEFPYFIRSATYVPLQEHLDSRGLSRPGEPRRPRGGSDIGYTERGGLTPVRAGALGAPKRQERPAKEGAKVETKAGEKPAAAAAGGGAAAAAPAGDLQPLVERAVKAHTRELHYTLQRSLGARGAVADDAWVAIYPEDEERSPDQALRLGSEQYLGWLNAKLQGNWGTAAETLVQLGPEHLDKAAQTIEPAKRALRQRGMLTAEEGWEEQNFDAAKEQLLTLKKLMAPFRPAGSLDEEPPAGSTDPQAVPEIVALGGNPEAIREYARANPKVAALAQELDGQGDDVVREKVASAAQRLRLVKEWAQELQKDPASPPPYGLTPESREEAIMLLEGSSPLPERVADFHRAWALNRLREVVGAATGDGGAVPFEVAKAGGSTPSRILRHDPDSPLARAVSKVLSESASPSPSPRLARLPASR